MKYILILLFILTLLILMYFRFDLISILASLQDVVSMIEKKTFEYFR